MSDWSPNTVTIIVALIGAIGVLIGTGGIGVALLQRNRTNAEAGEHTANARVKQAEAESIAVTTLKTAVEEIRKISADKEVEINELRQDMHAVRAQSKAESEEREERVKADMSEVKEELRELRAASDAARKAWSLHSQWDWNLYHWARSQGMPDLEEPPPMAW